MAQDKRLAHGTKLKLGDGASSETFTTVALLDTVSLPSESVASVDVSTHDTEDNMEFVAAALADGGSVSLGGILDPTVATHGYTASGAGIMKVFADKATRNWQIESPSGVWRVAFAGFITAKGGDANSGAGAEKLRLTFEIKVDGQPVFEAVA